MIPEAAVEAAVEAHCEGTMLAALEAAAPHMLAADAVGHDKLRAIIKNEDNYTHSDWTPEVNVDAMTEALLSYVLRVKAYAFNDGYNAATDAHGITK